MRHRYISYFAGIFLLAFFAVLNTGVLISVSGFQRLQKPVVSQPDFRRQPVSETMQVYLKQAADPGRDVGLYWMATDFENRRFPGKVSPSGFQKLYSQWRNQTGWDAYVQSCRAIWNDVKYFPIPQSLDDTEDKISYVDSWMFERNYGGKRGHEGTDIMAEKNTPGYYPVVSMTDGVVTEKGWLEKGGWRIGITAPTGAYFYYAHLDSYAELEKGDPVKAGDLLGYMGDSGYGEEGTTGEFPVHLHLGIYLKEGTEEISINPYPVLQYAENARINVCIPGSLTIGIMV